MAITRFARGTFIAALLAVAGIHAAQAVTLNVVSARNEPSAGITKGQAVTAYKFLVNIDNTGTTVTRAPTGDCSPVLADGTTPNANYPDSCGWTSIAGAKSHSPVYTQGTEADWAAKMGTVPAGRYLVSVLADGYKLDGRHFTVAADGSVTWSGTGAADTVELQPAPLPDAQIQSAVFEDVSPVNSAPDLPVERGLAGFQGHIVDYLGEVTTDVYGAPLCESGRCLSACYVVDNGVDIGLVQPTDAAGRCPVNVPANMSTCVAGASTDPLGYGAPYLVAVNAAAPRNTFKCRQEQLDAGLTLQSRPVPATAAIEGKVKVPNLGPNRYTLSVTPPDGSGWVQTTTLEGNHDWDAWVMEGATGLDTEFLIAGEPFPAIIFGYVPTPGTPSAVGSPVDRAMNGTNTIKGVVDAVKIYVPTTGGVGGLPGQIWGGLQGAKIDKPIENPQVTLTDLSNGDTIVWSGVGGADGSFTIPNVPDGTYTLTWWDEPQNQILDLVNVTVQGGETVDMGVLPLAGWWTFIDGYVFNDTNRNGVMDAGEPGLPGYTLTMRKRENSLMDRGTTATTTDGTGYYKFEAAYPMTQWLVEEAYDDLHYTTGITYQADNQPDPTTIIGAGVDVSIHPIIGLSGRLDWGKHTYAAIANGVDPQNGGIVGTVTYDTTRNELDPRYAAVEDWQPSISDLVVKLYQPVRVTGACIRQPAANATCDSTGRYQLAADGSILKGKLLNTYLTETWQRPTGCVARSLDGTPFQFGPDQQFLPYDPNDAANGYQDQTKGCIESPLTGIQFGTYATDQGTPDANFGAAVDGNYGFGDGCFGVDGFAISDPATGAGACADGSDPTALPAGDYLVQVDLGTGAAVDFNGDPVYKVTREEDINIANGDAFVPAVPPSACAGPMHVVDVLGMGADGANATDNATFVEIGGTPYEGQNRPLCDTKLVTLNNGKSIAPAFNLFTDVPLPGRHWFIIIDDLNFSSNPKSTTFGEKAGMPFVPVGIYDYTDRLVTTVESDYSGLADVLLPSTNRINCPTPSGVCGNLYRYVGNDPGVPGRLNLNYNPTFRTISAEFESLPGLLVPADLAPTQVGVTVQVPGGQTTNPVLCMINDAVTPAAQLTPEFYAISRPYVSGAGATRNLTISGRGFGATPGQVLLGTTAVQVTGWSDNSIAITVPTAVPVGPYQMSIVAGNQKRSINAVTVHVIGGAYSPAIYEVSPVPVDATIPANRRFAPAETLPAAANHAIQNAINAAAPGSLVVVYPNNTSANPRQNPRGAYYENLIINKRIKLQGVGPGSPDGSVRGSIIDGGAFAGDSPVATDWYTTINAMTWDGNQTIYDGAVISVYVNQGTMTTGNSLAQAAAIDGFDLRGGDQQGFPGNINVIGGGATGQPGGLITQGGAVFANAYAQNLRVTNNVVQNNGGAYGTIRIGTPDLTGDASSHNDGVVIDHNRIVANAGTNLAGGIGLFGGANNYVVSNNDICGNFSAEYGGGVSHVGSSPGGSINNNRIYLNRSYDEGGGVMIAGALPADAATLSPGAGSVSVFNNIIQSNLSNDDGGGLRFLMAGGPGGAAVMNVYNNIITNNVSTHEGGGVSINDTPTVRFYNNTVMKNLTTATAITSNGLPAPTGLSTSNNSAPLQATMPVGSPTFSDPLLFNNVFWDNRAGTRALDRVTGLGAVGDPTPIDYWDLGNADDVLVPLTPTNSVLQTPARGATASPTNVSADPQVVQATDIAVTFNAWRNNPAFLGAILISADLPPNLTSNYHLAGTGSPAVSLGAANKAGVSAPTSDIDNQTRPQGAGLEAGADELSTVVTTDVAVTLSNGGTTVAAGGASTYTITVTNTTGVAAAGVNLAATWAPAASFTASGWSCAAPAGSSCTANVAARTGVVNLGPNASVTYTLVGTVAGGASGTLATTATLTFPATVIDTNGGNNTATDTDTVQGSANLGITKNDFQTSVTRGQVLNYNVVVSNFGPNTATGAVMTDNVPASLTNVSWTCTSTANATARCGGTTSGTGNAISRTLGAIPSGNTVTFTVTGTVGNTATGNIANTATVTPPAGLADPNTANNTATDTDTVNVPSVNLAITKTDGVASAVPGQLLVYTIVVTNNGPANVPAGAVMNDTVPATLTGVTWTCASGNGNARCGGVTSGSGNAISRTLGAMNNGQTVTFTVRGTVAAGATGSVANTATVAAPASVSDPNLANNTATDTDTLPAALLAPARVASPVTLGVTTLATGPAAAPRKGKGQVGARDPSQLNR